MARAAAHLFAAALALSAPGALLAQEAPASDLPGALFPDSVRRDMADGRYRKASLALRVHLEPLASASLGARLVLAEAEAGWKNWNGAISALSAGSVDTAQAPARLWYLLGVARQATGDRDGAARDLRRFLDASGTESRETLAARARVAALLAEMGAADGAIEVLEELHAHSPVVAGWAALAVAGTLASQGGGRGGAGGARPDRGPGGAQAGLVAGGRCVGRIGRHRASAGGAGGPLRR